MEEPAGPAGSAEMADDMPASDPKPSLSRDNCVEYMVFVVHGRDETGKLLPALERIRRRGMQLCEEYTKGYIWQKEAFALEVKSEQGLLFLYGSTEYGDCVEDEWLVVFLLRELSKSFAEAWIRVFDGDGEFLFIEAASVAPKWLSPESDAHRAWIHKGELHIIAPGSQAGAKAGSISLPEAMDYLRNKPGELVHSSFVEAEAFYRLEKYPRCIQESMHHALATIPRKLAYVLHDRPRSVAPAVEAFYLRDPVALNPILAASPALHFPPTDLVTVSVRFTRTLFAQLRSQRFDPSPPQWRPLLEAAEKQSSGPSDGPPAKDLLETGMKLTTGFEMLLATAKTSNQRIVREIALIVADLEEDGEDAAVLASDEAIKSWTDVDRHDDDSWLDIDFADFERELEGASGRKRDGPGNKGFGDATAQADLRKIVERFEGFLNDDRAGLDGALVDEMDEDDEESDEDDGDGGDSGDEDIHVSFDEAQFESMMRQMMGLPGTAGLATQYTEQPRRGVDDEAKRATDEDKEIQELAAHFESELHSHGVLRLDPAAPKRPVQLADGQHSKPDTAPKPAAVPSATEDESADEEVDIDYNLAKNLLESFKGQTGMPGPAGNILRMMGMSLPRDEDDG